MAQANNDEEKKGNDDDDDESKGQGFDDNLFKTLNALNKKKSNLICSPLSILTALTISMCGAQKNTLKEMLNVLYRNRKTKEATNENAQKLTFEIMNICKYYNKEFDGDQDKPILNIVNKLWIKKGFKILDSYIKAIGVNSIDSIDSSKAAEAAIIVNKWFADNTNNMITEIVNETIMKNTDLLISNAIYFSGKFVNPFPEKDTVKNVDFYSDRRQTKTLCKVTMMHSLREQYIAEEVNGVWDVVKLEYANSMLALFLVINNWGKGDENILTANDLLYNLNDYWSKAMCNLFIPKFKFEFEIQLNDILEQMGIKDAFGGNADFGAITESKGLYIDKVVHKAIIEIDEKGTKAAGGTVVAMSRCLPPTKRFDHPFNFYIIDQAKKITLFEGTFEGN